MRWVSLNGYSHYPEKSFDQQRTQTVPSLPCPPSSPRLPLNALFLRGAMAASDFPPESYPEVAFVGRSNVGKSSLINGLLNRKNLAHISKKPGKTAQINFFNVSDRFILVDMPGYGYAAVSQKMRKLWGSLMPSYFEVRESWIHTFVLIDSRHPPQKTDLQLLDFLMHQRRPFTVILTKADKTSRAILEEQIAQISHLTRGGPTVDILPFSIKNKELKEAAQEQLLKIISE